MVEPTIYHQAMCVLSYSGFSRKGSDETLFMYVEQRSASEYFVSALSYGKVTLQATERSYVMVKPDGVQRGLVMHSLPLFLPLFLKFRRMEMRVLTWKELKLLKNRALDRTSSFTLIEK